MDIILTFLEGTITFISPCLLPMLPVYLSFFTGQNANNKKQTALLNSIGFVSGFTLVFILLGALAGTVGKFLNQYSTAVNIVSGIIVILFGLNFIGILNISFINLNRQVKFKRTEVGFLSSALFGIIFSIGWTPCVGAFLGSALMLAASGGNSAKGVLMLLSFSLGLGIPFIASAVLIDKLKSTLDFIKRHYKIINIISGSFLVVIGILIATGLMGHFISLLSF